MIARLRRWWTERQKTHGHPRSPLWPRVRRDFLLANPECAACGTRHSLEVHHVSPFHVRPELELDERNLVTLCEGVSRCHLEIGHGGAWPLVVPSVRELAAMARNGRREEALRRAHDEAHGASRRAAA